MALRLLDKIKEFIPIPGKREMPPGGLSTTTLDVSASVPGTREIPKPRQTWLMTLVSGVPLGMLVIGALVTACSQLIGLWALLGYLLLVGAPIVYWLQQIEKRLSQLLELTRQRRGPLP